MDGEQRKRTRTTAFGQDEEERSFPQSGTVGSESERNETGDYESEQESDCSDEGFIYSNSDIEFLEESNSYYSEEFEEDDIDPDELSYEELIALGETVGIENRGLSEAEIGRLLHPFTCQSTKNLIIDSCVMICQVEYEVGEKLVTLRCDHQYHSDCLTKWLQINKICPICTKEVSCGKNTSSKG